MLWLCYQLLLYVRVTNKTAQPAGRSLLARPPAAAPSRWISPSCLGPAATASTKDPRGDRGVKMSAPTAGAGAEDSEGPGLVLGEAREKL